MSQLLHCSQHPVSSKMRDHRTNKLCAPLVWVVCHCLKLNYLVPATLIALVLHSINCLLTKPIPGFAAVLHMHGVVLINPCLIRVRAAVIVGFNGTRGSQQSEWLMRTQLSVAQPSVHPCFLWRRGHKLFQWRQVKQYCSWTHGQKASVW